jgi:hypothetical protein
MLVQMHATVFEVVFVVEVAGPIIVFKMEVIGVPFLIDTRWMWSGLRHCWARHQHSSSENEEVFHLIPICLADGFETRSEPLASVELKVPVRRVHPAATRPHS